MKVPQLDNLRADVSVQPQVQFAAPNTGAIGEVAARQGEAMSQGLMRAGEAAGRIALDIQNEANQTRINDAYSSLLNADTALRVDMQSQRGVNALNRESGMSLVDEYQEKLGKEIDALSQGLGNDAQRAAFKQRADQVAVQFRSAATQHLFKAQEEYRDDTDTKELRERGKRYATLYGSQQVRDEELVGINATIKRIGDRKGWDETQRKAALQEVMDPVHAFVITNMIEGGRAKEAQAYFDQNSTGMSLQAQASILRPLQSATVAQEADAGAAAIWQQFGPDSPNAPVKIFDLEQAARKQYGGDSDKAGAVVTRLRSMAQAFNAQQSELKAGNVAGVWKQVDDGASMSHVMRSGAWLALDDTTQHEILRAMESERATKAQRQASEEQRELARLQREDRLALLRNGADYLTATDPTVLSQMSRAQVEALRTKFGREATEQLLTKWDSLKKPGKMTEARMDTEDFNNAAESLGLHPYDPKKSEEDRAALGTLKYRVEQLIDLEQGRLSRALSRQEKQDLMRQEMARTVTVDGFFKNQTVPVVQLTPAQLAKIEIPAADRAQAMEALQVAYAKTGNPAYAPTEDNVRRLYVRKISPAGALIPNGQ